MIAFSEMASHVKTHESDSTYFAISTTIGESEIPAFTESKDLVCPMCGKVMEDLDLLTSHVETHFSSQHRPGKLGLRLQFGHFV